MGGVNLEERSRQAVAKVLLVSDNPDLTKWFQAEMTRRAATGWPSVDYRYSAVNREPSAMIALGAGPFDAKNPDEVAQVAAEYGLVISLHCKQIFPEALVSGTLCVNVHPGLNPYNRGWYPQVFSLINGLPIGATIHVMDAEVDHGDIIDQEAVEVLPSDTSLEVYSRVTEMEKVLIARNLDALLTRSFERRSPVEGGNYNGIRDFRDLCDLCLDDVATLREHLNLLRALSHGDFKNAYFVEDGVKYFVRVAIEPGSDHRGVGD